MRRIEFCMQNTVYLVEEVFSRGTQPAYFTYDKNEDENILLLECTSRVFPNVVF